MFTMKIVDAIYLYAHAVMVNSSNIQGLIPLLFTTLSTSFSSTQKSSRAWKYHNGEPRGELPVGMESG